MKSITKKLYLYYNEYGLFRAIKIIFNLYFLKNGKISKDLIIIPGKENALVFENIILKKEFNIPLGNIIPKTIVDLGANVGLGSVYFASKYPSAKIYAVEPDLNNFKVLEQNIAPFNNITPINAAIWNTDTWLEKKVGTHGGLSFSYTESQKGRGGCINAMSMNTLIKEFNIDDIDILKIDIEGGEKKLFESNYVSWIKKVGIFIVELHDRKEKNSSRSFYKAITNFEFSQKTKGCNVIIYMH